MFVVEVNSVNSFEKVIRRRKSKRNFATEMHLKPQSVSKLG